MKFHFLMILITVSSCSDIYAKREARSTALSRRKRYIAFPEGSTFAATLCATIATIADFGIYFEGLNWGTAWTLPNRSTVEEYVLMYKHKKRRKQRRDLYNQIELVVDHMGYDGRSCIYKALCEAPRKFKSKPKSLSEDLLWRFFKFPLQSLSRDEPEDHHLYHAAYHRGKREEEDCSKMFPDCSISLIELIMGRYDDYT